ncbi:hypothetical protein L21SP4_01318 [Kiritimatiella glycovorans]|uniref:Uncharacterized protein n=2 Tax=Kiritimatiella glycovorans TaxID=1307763 RepID=A0A0G3EDP2_9BACT|nr:hypothetical protein L21SP4_01318 [Kiritimatiella glycovorans]
MQPVLDSFRFNTQPVQAGFQLTGLTVGQEYEVQIWIGDARTATIQNRYATIDKTRIPSSGAWGTSMYIATGTFVADAAAQDLTVSMCNSVDNSALGTQLHAYQLRSIKTAFVIPKIKSRHVADTVLWYNEPADEWENAMPLGNGSLGAMVYGGVSEENIQLNNDTLWAGRPVDLNRTNAFEHLDDIRSLMFEGKYSDAQNLVETEMLTDRPRPRSYQTLGNLRLKFDHGEIVEDYWRELNLDTAIASIKYIRHGVEYRREIFISPVDHALIMKISVNEPGALSCQIFLDRPDQYETRAESSSALVMSGEAMHPGHRMPDQRSGTKYQVRVKAVHEGGTCSATNNTLMIANADSLTLYLSSATDYNRQNPAEPAPDGWRDRNQEVLHDVLGKSYDDLRGDHIAEHQRLFQRVALQFIENEQQPSPPVDERFRLYREGSEDRELEALLFQFGRYLLISSSRPGSMPANLQSIWCKELTAPWNADYHLDINVQMTYWPTEICNLAELREPFIYMLNRLRDNGGRTAGEVYGCRGFATATATDGWWYTYPFIPANVGMYPTGGAWLSLQLWDHYLFTGDRLYLEHDVYPIVRDAAQFFADYLVENPRTGKFVCGPSISPENLLIGPDGNVAAITYATTHDQTIIKQLYCDYLEIVDVLGIEDNLTTVVSDQLGQLQEPLIGEDGHLKEYNNECSQFWPAHRHISHLAGLFYPHKMTLFDQPEYEAAALKVLNSKEELGAFDEPVDWTVAWTACMYAALGRGDDAYRFINMFLNQNCYDSMFAICSPEQWRLPQTDGNYGITAAFATMLLQSNFGTIEILPAVPWNHWPQGKFEGLCARGGFTVDVQWADRLLQTLTIHSGLGSTCRLKLDHNLTEGSFEVLCEGKAVPVSISEGVASFPTQKGQTYQVVCLR